MSVNNATPQAAAPVAQETAASTQDQTVQDSSQESSTLEASGSTESPVQEAKEVLNDPNASKKEKKVAESTLKKYNIKVDGRSEVVELDLNDEAAVSKHLQMSRAAQRKMQEASDMRRAAEEFITLLKTDPQKVLTDPNIGVDLKKLAQDVINAEIENAQKSPEQLEKEKLQRELADIKAKIEDDEKKRKSSELQRLQQEQQQKIEANIESALKTSDLPKTAYTVRKMAEMMLIALQNNVDLSPADIVPLIRKQMATDIKELFGASSDDVLEELVGKDRISKIRKKKVAAVQQQVAQTANQVKNTGGKGKTTETPPKKMTIKEFLNR
jgi:hypothetical protein